MFPYSFRFDLAITIKTSTYVGDKSRKLQRRVSHIGSSKIHNSRSVLSVSYRTYWATSFPGLFSAEERKGPSSPRPFLSSAEKSPGNEVAYWDLSAPRSPALTPPVYLTRVYLKFSVSIGLTHWRGFQQLRRVLQKVPKGAALF